MKTRTSLDSPLFSKVKTPKRGELPVQTCFESGQTLHVDPTKDLIYSMNMIKTELERRSWEAEKEKQLLKSALLKSLVQDDESYIEEDGLFDFDSDCEAASISNRQTIERILREICMTEDPENREVMIRTMNSCAALQFLVALKENGQEDCIALYYSDGLEYRKLIGDSDLPPQINESSVLMKFSYYGGTLVETSSKHPHTVLIT